MKIACCTTTIHVPHALKLLRKCSDGVRFFVACDQKTPIETNLLCGEVKNAWAIFPEMQQEWRCSESLGWNTLARRNIAFLEALKWGADIIYSWDDDNLVVDTKHWQHIHELLAHNVTPTLNLKFHGLKIAGDDNWFDPGFLLVPRTKHRGFPHDKSRMVTMDHVEDARIGVAAGLVLGDPDIDAVTRIADSPDIQSVSIVGQAGIVVDPQTRTVFNSQNTAVIRELIPAWFMMPGVGRYDDIYASLIVQRVARERGLHVHFGPPFTYQQRNKHNLLTDLRAEIDGMEHIVEMADLLDTTYLHGDSVIDDTRTIYRELEHRAKWIPDESIYAAFRWIEDCEGVL